MNRLATGRWWTAALAIGVAGTGARAQVAADLSRPAPKDAPAVPRLEVSVSPARIEAAPGGIGDPISVTVTNGGPLPTTITVTVEGVLGWASAKAQTAELTPGGSTMLTMYIRAPGLAGPASDSIVVRARADGDNNLTGEAAIVGARRACIADWDGLGGLRSHDVVMFLGDVFRRTADFDGDGETTASDLYAFLDAYFGGC